MKRSQRLLLGLAIVSVIGLSACANLTSIGRTTRLAEPSSTSRGKAIHLDAQQRLVVVNNLQRFCAEPNPDAMAAYAAGLSAGLSQGKGTSGSAAAALQSAAGSIGLRTQSITLMRDALYRLCEAHLNDAINDVQAAVLLGRSQDLTAVALAVEQLTGAVAANQIILTGKSSSDSSADLLSNQKLLAEARKAETAASAAVEAAKKKHIDTVTTVAAKTAEASAAESTYTATPDVPADAKATALADWNAKKKAAEDAKSAESNAKTALAAAEATLADATKTREVLESSQDSLLTSASANTDSTGSFSQTASRNQLNAEATKAIADAVQAMIQTALGKTYYAETCLAMFNSGAVDIAALSRTGNVLDDLRRQCIALLSVGTFQENLARTSSMSAPSSEVPQASLEVLRSMSNPRDYDLPEFQNSWPNSDVGTLNEPPVSERWRQPENPQPDEG